LVVSLYSLAAVVGQCVLLRVFLFLTALSVWSGVVVGGNACKVCRTVWAFRQSVTARRSSWVPCCGLKFGVGSPRLCFFCHFLLKQSFSVGSSALCLIDAVAKCLA